MFIYVFVLCVSLCRGVDQKLKLLLDDANHYIRPQDSAAAADDSDGPFDRFADKKQITEFLQTACESCITKWVQWCIELCPICTEKLELACFMLYVDICSIVVLETVSLSHCNVAVCGHFKHCFWSVVQVLSIGYISFPCVFNGVAV